MKRFFNYGILLGLIAMLAACAHDTEPVDPNAHLKSDAFEVSAQGGDEVLLRSTAGNEAQTTISGTLKVRGVKPGFVGPLDIHLLDTDGTIYARTKSDKQGAFVLNGSIVPGYYIIKIVAKKYRGELPVIIDHPEIKDLVVPVEAVIR